MTVDEATEIAKLLLAEGAFPKCLAVIIRSKQQKIDRLESKISILKNRLRMMEQSSGDTLSGVTQ